MSNRHANHLPLGQSIPRPSIVEERDSRAIGSAFLTSPKRKRGKDLPSLALRAGNFGLVEICSLALNATA